MELNVAIIFMIVFFSVELNGLRRKKRRRERCSRLSADISGLRGAEIISIRECAARCRDTASVRRA